MAYSKQTWDTTSYVNPTRMNHIEQGIYDASTATGTEYSSGVSVKDMIDDLSTWESINLGTPTVSDRRRTYSVDLTGYNEVAVSVFINGYGNAGTYLMPANGGDMRNFYKSDGGHEFGYVVQTSSNSISVDGLSWSHNVGTNYFILSALKGKK